MKYTVVNITHRGHIARSMDGVVFVAPGVHEIDLIDENRLESSHADTGTAFRDAHPGDIATCEGHIWTVTPR